MTKDVSIRRSYVRQADGVATLSIVIQKQQNLSPHTRRGQISDLVKPWGIAPQDRLGVRIQSSMLQSPMLWHNQSSGSDGWTYHCLHYRIMSCWGSTYVTATLEPTTRLYPLAKCSFMAFSNTCSLELGELNNFYFVHVHQCLQWTNRFVQACHLIDDLFRPSRNATKWRLFGNQEGNKIMCIRLDGRNVKFQLHWISLTDCFHDVDHTKV